MNILDFVQKLSFIRFGGTEDEHKAASRILEEIEKHGGCGALEEFQVPACKCKRCSFTVTSPYTETLQVMPWGASGSFPTGGVDLKLFYAEDCSEMGLHGKDDLSDTAVLVNELSRDQYKTLCEKKAAAILLIMGKWYDSPANADLLQRQLRPAYTEFGKIPTFSVWSSDAIKLIKSEARSLHIELEQEEFETTSRNVIATIPGTEITDESLLITAHYDSVNVGTGSWDNATGAAVILYIYGSFLKNKPRRTLRFVWCGSEEQGLLGSKAYALAHADQIEKEIKFAFNFDMCGTVIGTNKVTVTGSDPLKHYAEAFCKEYGICATVHQDVRSSDSAVFADKGIPTVDLFRVGKASEIHTRHDLIQTLSDKQLKKDGDFAVAFIERVVNSAHIPIGNERSDAIIEKLDKYFHRK